MDVKDLLPVIEEVKSLTAGRMEAVETKQAEFQAMLLDLAQRSGKRGDVLSMGDMHHDLVEAIKASPDLERMRKGARHMRVDLPMGYLNQKASTIPSLPLGYQPGLLPGVVIAPTRRTFMRDVIGSVTTTAGGYQYVVEAGFTNNAAPVAENTLKPQSDLSLNLVQAPITTIAHWMRATKQILDDVREMVGYLDSRLRYGLALAEDAQILNGDGTGVNLNGLLHQAPVFTAPVVTGDTKIDILQRAMAHLQTAEYSPNVIVLNTIDWSNIKLTKDSQGRYIFGDPADTQPPQIWNVPVVWTNAIATGRYMVADMMLAARLIDRQAPTLDISSEDQDNFVKNLVTLRVEERTSLAVFRPDGLLQGTFA